MITLSSIESRAATAAQELADTLAVPPPHLEHADHGPDSPRWHGQSLSQGHAGIAVLHALRARDGSGTWERALVWFTAAVREPLAAAGGAGLWHGAPAVAFALHTAPIPGNELLLTRLDAAITAMVTRQVAAADARITARQRPEPGEFDLVRGLTGLGVYLLARHPGSPHLDAVLRYLVRLTEPVPADDTAAMIVPGWWTGHVPDGKPTHDYQDGHSDQGMAHGITGPLALMALACRAGVTVPGQINAITTIQSWLEDWRQDGPAGPWWPERITLAEHATRWPRQNGPARPSWCYGTPGIARALHLAAQTLHDPARQTAAEDVLLACVTDTAQLARLDTPALCHGWAGLIAAVAATSADATTPALANQLPALITSLLDRLDLDPGERPGLIDGTAGVALLLHSLTTGQLTGWTNSLLLTGTCLS
ncbi:lanthionine synthetase C family protein [Actinoallomurus sp. CA-150999]|uniref:lanthionine synthetase C family protein n=1 Tax=Actinoallomurus sp. CA-150999 TaxID=3239887 RepID=UPI003D8C5CC0